MTTLFSKAVPRHSVATKYNAHVSTNDGDQPKELNPMLAQAVTEALTKRGWSLRAAHAYSGVNYNTIDRLKKGLSAEPEQIIRFARAVAEKGKEVETALHFLKLAGKDDIVSLLREVEKLAAQVPAEDRQTVLMPTGETVEVIATADGPGIQFEATTENLALLGAVMRAAGQAK